MGDDDDGLAVGDQVLHDREQLIDLLLRQDCRRFIQDQDLGAAVEGLEDLDALLHADRNIPDLGIRLDLESVLLDDLADILAGLAHVDADPCRPGLGTQDYVLRDREILHQHKVLVHHADAVFDRGRRIFDIDLFAVDIDLALVRLIQTVQDVHQCTLAGAVLAEDRMDRSPLHVEINVGQRIEGTKPLGDSMHLYSIFTADFS